MCSLHDHETHIISGQGVAHVQYTMDQGAQMVHWFASTCIAVGLPCFARACIEQPEHRAHRSTVFDLAVSSIALHLASSRQPRAFGATSISRLQLERRELKLCAAAYHAALDFVHRKRGLIDRLAQELMRKDGLVPGELVDQWLAQTPDEAVSEETRASWEFGELLEDVRACLLRRFLGFVCLFSAAMCGRLQAMWGRACAICTAPLSVAAYCHRSLKPHIHCHRGLLSDQTGFTVISCACRPDRRCGSRRSRFCRPPTS